MVELTVQEMGFIKPFCSEKDDVVLKACADGKIGKVWVDNKLGPVCAVAAAADFCFLLGKPEGIKPDELVALLADNCRGKVIVPENEDWRPVFEKNFPGAAKFLRYAIKKEPFVFDKDRLTGFISAIGPEYKVEGIDERLYHKSLDVGWTADFCCFYPSYAEFSQHGIGYVIEENGMIISGASSYFYCEGAIEITIETVQEYRHKGLALACASRLILECLERDIYPRWDAANLESLALAQKLGYNFSGDYWVYSI